MSIHVRVAALVFALAVVSVAPLAVADETCNSPYTAGLIKGQEDYVHVWTLGVNWLGDGSDKLVTIDVNPEFQGLRQGRPQLSVGGRGEAHHMGFTDDRKYLWAGRSRRQQDLRLRCRHRPCASRRSSTRSPICPRRPAIVGPHTFYALPGRMLIGSALQHQGPRRRHRHGRLQQQRRVRRQVRHAHGQIGAARATATATTSPSTRRRTCLLTSSFTGWNNYMMDLGKLVKDREAMKHFGNTMVVWNLKAMKPRARSSGARCTARDSLVAQSEGQTGPSRPPR